MKNIIKISVVADFHLEKLSLDQAKKEINEFFIPTIKDISPAILFIAGDIFDNKLNLTSPYIVLINKMIYELKNLNICVVLIHGTLSHDNKQILSFSHYLDENFHIFIEKGVFIYNNLKFLILPEEYHDDKKKYYKEELYSGNKYDFIIGHGVLDLADFIDKLSKIKISQMIFHHNDFKNKFYGRVIFGHYHTHIKKNNILYVGSLSRFKFGENENKGFMTFHYDIKKKEVIREIFHINHLCNIYKTLHCSKIPDKNTIDFLVKQKKECFKLKIVLNKQIDAIKYNNILTFSQKTENVSIKFENKEIIENKKDETKYKFDISDFENKGITDITMMHLKENNEFNITSEYIQKVLRDK